MAICPSGKSYIVRTKAGTYLRGMQYIKADHSGSEQAFKVVSANNAGGLVSCMKVSSSVQAVRPGMARRRVAFDSAVQYVA